MLEEVCRQNTDGLFHKIEAGDVHEDLILMWRAVQTGWIPPDSITSREYAILKAAAPSPLRAFAGFGASFGGKWWGGYGRRESGVEDNRLVQASKNSVMRTAEFIRGVRFKHRSFDQWDCRVGDVIYADPPYDSTTEYEGAGKFDHDKFWNWCDILSKNGVRILVSEFTCPFSHWGSLQQSVREPILNLNQPGAVATKEAERIFIHQDYLSFFEEIENEQNYGAGE